MATRWAPSKSFRRSAVLHDFLLSQALPGAPDVPIPAPIPLPRPLKGPDTPLRTGLSNGKCRSEGRKLGRRAHDRGPLCVQRWLQLSPTTRGRRCSRRVAPAATAARAAAPGWEDQRAGHRGDWRRRCNVDSDTQLRAFLCDGMALNILHLTGNLLLHLKEPPTSYNASHTSHNLAPREADPGQ